MGEEFYQEEPVVFEYMKDSLIEYARRVIIPIPHRVGKKVKMELYFSARWILISEVKFESGRWKHCVINWFEFSGVSVVH